MRTSGFSCPSATLVCKAEIRLAQWETDRCRPKRGKHRHPERHHGHANLETLKIVGLLDRPRAAGDLPNPVVPRRIEAIQTDSFDVAPDDVAQGAIHSRPHLIVAGKCKTYARDRGRWNNRGEDRAGKGRKLEGSGPSMSESPPS
jgi:hypothetical protein